MVSIVQFCRGGPRGCSSAHGLRGGVYLSDNFEGVIKFVDWICGSVVPSFQLEYIGEEFRRGTEEGGEDAEGGVPLTILP